MATITTTNELTPINGILASGAFGEHTPGETISNALIVTRREVRDSLRDWRIMMPIFALTLVFPLLANGMTGLFIHFFEVNGAAPLVNNFLPLMPMIVGFFPVSISLVIALETFVGEKERRSLEPLLSTPLTNMELYMGKTFAAMIPPLLASYIGISLYVGALVLGPQHWELDAGLILQIMALTTAQALIMVTGSVVVSSQTTSTRASNLLASFIIIPMALLVMLESFIMVTNNRYILWYILVGLLVADVMLFGMGARLFNREELLGRAIDEINLKWAWRLFWNQFRGGPDVHNIVDWYRRSVLPAVPRLRGALIIVGIGILGALVGGYALGVLRPDVVGIPAQVGNHDVLVKNFTTYMVMNGSRPDLVVAAVIQNGRILLVATILAVFSFGVMGIIFAIAPFGIAGYALGHPALSSIGLGAFAAALIPHSLIEVPAIILATAAAVRLGAIITRPPEGQGVWDSWLGALADAIKVGIGLVLPMLIVAAIVEVYVTPYVVRLALGS
ncbi:MAG TPA: stage II sporulation protein M [Aggregatilineales bacterium]|nr:stage II sporulation protein M [Aggregatilineales bacterium]